MGQVENVSVETDPAFDRALKAAVQRGGSDPDAVLNALVEELGITGGTVKFTVSGLNNASVGRQSLDVLFLPGADPTAAANNAAVGWLPTLRSLSGNGGEYSSRVSLMEVNGGCIVAIEVTVEQPGDDGDEPEPVTLTGISVSGCKTEYFVGQSFDPTGMTITATYSDNSTKTITGITETDKKDVSWDTEKFTNAGTKTVTISYGGKTATATVNVQKGYTVDGNTYKVSTAHGLKSVAELVNNYWKLDIDITLTDDIDLTDINWTPIGIDDNNAYTGTFDGNGKTITGLTVNQEGTNYVGLIGYLGSGGKVQNVTLTDVSVTGYWYVGGVVGANDKGTVTACTASGSISGSSRVGGVVGYNGGAMTGCTVSGSVSGDSSVGGVVGWNGGTVTACYATSDVSGYSDVGGVAGRNYYGTVTGCTSSGSVSGSLNVGGVVGYNYGIVTACYWSGLPDNDNGGATKVDGTNVTWQTAVDAMNAALQNAGSEWRYELTGALPILKKQ